MNAIPGNDARKSLSSVSIFCLFCFGVIMLIRDRFRCHSEPYLYFIAIAFDSALPPTFSLASLRGKTATTVQRLPYLKPWLAISMALLEGLGNNVLELSVDAAR